jgi:transcriptional regulator with XRE-family HTH domain
MLRKACALFFSEYCTFDLVKEVNMTNTRRLRLERGLTQEELAHRAHLTVSTVAAVDSGRVKHPSSEVLYKLAKALGTTMDELYRNEATKQFA